MQVEGMGVEYAGRVRGACFAGARVTRRVDLSLQRQFLNELQLLVRWWYPLQPAGPSAASKVNARRRACHGRPSPEKRGQGRGGGVAVAMAMVR